MGVVMSSVDNLLEWCFALVDVKKTRSAMNNNGSQHSKDSNNVSDNLIFTHNFLNILDVLITDCALDNSCFVEVYESHHPSSNTDLLDVCMSYRQ